MALTKVSRGLLSTGIVDNSNATAITIDSSENVGIGTSSPSAKLHVDNGSGSALYVGLANNIYSRGAEHIWQSLNNASEYMRIDSSGRVLLGQDSGDAFNADAMLRLQRTGDRLYQSFKVDADQEAAIFFGDVDDDIECGIVYDAATQSLAFNSGNNSEAMRIDSSNNLLVGKSGTSFGTAGIEARSGGTLWATANVTNPASFNRLGNYGPVVYINSANNPVGNIGTTTGDSGAATMYIADQGNVGIRFDQASTDDIQPCTSSGADRDNAINLGATDNRFKDLYLSGAAFVGGKVNTGSITTDNANTQFNKISRTGGVALYVQQGDNTNDILQLRSGNGQAGTGTQRVTVTASGNLLVGTTANGNISSAHEIRGVSSSGGNSILTVSNTSGTASCPALNVANRDASTDSSNRFVQFYADYTGSTATAMGGIVGNGASNVQFAALSDVREKQNIEAITNSLDKITSLNPVEFDWITSGEHCKAGFIAQEVEEVFPEFVVENMASEGQEERKGLTGGMTGGIVAHLVKAIQEQQTLIESLTTRIAALETGE